MRYQVRVAVLIPRGIGRPDPKTTARVYEIETSVDGDLGRGLASVEAIKRATAQYGETGDYPYVVAIDEVA